MPHWLRAVAALSPLTHVVELLRIGVHGESALGPAWVPAAASVAFLALSALAAVRIFGRRAAGA
jgi:hypothetical protein